MESSTKMAERMVERVGIKALFFFHEKNYKYLIKDTPKG
jgi:hypothetical protein